MNLQYAKLLHSEFVIGKLYSCMNKIDFGQCNRTSDPYLQNCVKLVEEELF